MLAKQNTELKIANEGLRLQLSNTQHNAEQILASQVRAQRLQDADAMILSEQDQAMLKQKQKYF